jgi:EmrB/QacA subfamily drug resistance transporter
MVALDTLVVSTALSTIRRQLGASLEDLEWIVNAYSLSFAVLLMSGAALGDRFGRRRVFASGLGLFVAASAACALAPNLLWLIAARALQGSGAAMVMPLALALVSAAFPPELRGKALGIFSGVSGLAVVAGPVVGGAIAEGLAWQWIFWLNVPIGVLTIPLVLGRVKESFGTTTSRLDLVGIALVTGAALGIVWGLVRGNSALWGSLEVLAALLGGFLLGVAFVLWELHAPEPLLPMRFFRVRAFWAGNVASFFLYASLYSAIFFMAQFLQNGLGYGPLAAGLRLIPWTATLFIVAPLAGALVNRLGERPLVAGGLLLQTIGMSWIALIARPGLSYPALIPPLMVAGCGVSMALPTTQSCVVGAVAKSEIGKASGIFSMLRQLGGVFGIASLVAMFTAWGSFGSAQEFSQGFTLALVVCAGLALIGALASIWLPGRHEKALAQARLEGKETLV